MSLYTFRDVSASPLAARVVLCLVSTAYMASQAACAEFGAARDAGCAVVVLLEPQGDLEGNPSSPCNGAIKMYLKANQPVLHLARYQNGARASDERELAGSIRDSVSDSKGRGLSVEALAVLADAVHAEVQRVYSAAGVHDPRAFLLAEANKQVRREGGTFNCMTSCIWVACSMSMVMQHEAWGS